MDNESVRTNQSAADRHRLHTIELVHHQTMIVKIEALTLSHLSYNDAGPVMYDGNKPWDNWVDVHPWDDSVPELRQWLKRWGHVMAFPIPHDLNLVSPFILSRFWRLKPSEIIRERVESNGSEIRSGFDGEPITEFFSNVYLAADGSTITSAAPGPMFSEPKSRDREPRTSWPASNSLRLAFRISPNFSDREILDSIRDHAVLALKQIRNDLCIIPKFDESNVFRDENVYEYFLTWDTFIRFQQADLNVAEYSVANELWPESFNMPTKSVKKIIEDSRKAKKDKAIKKAQDRVRHHISRVKEWIKELEPQDFG
jgi:hypothetical protein